MRQNQFKSYISQLFHQLFYWNHKRVLMRSTSRNYNTRREKEFDSLSQCSTLCNDDSEPRIVLGTLDSGQYIFEPK